MTLIDSDELWSPENRQDYALFVHEDSFIFEMIILNNIMFNVFSISNIDNLKPYFDDLKLDVDVKRIRNSYMHGRYYYNHDNRIEFYDGRNNDNLTHIASLTIDNIIDICADFIEDNLNRLETIPNCNTHLNPN